LKGWVLPSLLWSHLNQIVPQSRACFESVVSVFFLPASIWTFSRSRAFFFKQNILSACVVEAQELTMKRGRKQTLIQVVDNWSLFIFSL
jgi:hypothetical protein